MNSKSNAYMHPTRTVQQTVELFSRYYITHIMLHKHFDNKSMILKHWYFCYDKQKTIFVQWHWYSWVLEGEQTFTTLGRMLLKLFQFKTRYISILVQIHFNEIIVVIQKFNISVAFLLFLRSGWLDVCR